MEYSECYSYFTISDEANIAVTLMRNRADFNWLNDEKTQQMISKLFMFLSQKDALSFCYFLYNINSPGHFTADFVAQKLGISKEKATELLEIACNIKLCSKITAHLALGDMPLYKSSASGDILAIITIAFEYMYRNNRMYDFHYIREAKMIGGNKNEFI